MAHVSSEIQDVSPKDGPNGSGKSCRSLLCDQTISGDLVFRSMIEENAFQTLCEEFLIKRPCYTQCVSEPDEDKDFCSLTFPRKLWKMVGSDQFQSIRWDDNGTSIVIDEDIFKKEVLERKAPFRIFETGSMKSLIRQLNLYGFSKVQQNLQRSASLADFLAEEKEVSVLRKLQFYHNPNFKRGCPQLLVKIKRRVGIKNDSLVSSLAQGFKKKHFKQGGNVDNHNSGFVVDTRGESAFLPSANLTMPLKRKPSTSHIIGDTSTPMRVDFSPASSMSVRPPEQIAVDQRAILNQLTTFHVDSQSSYTEENGRVVNFITTKTSNSKYSTLSPKQSNYHGLMVEPSTFPNRYHNISANEGPFSKLQAESNPWFPVPVIADTSATSLSWPTHQPTAGYDRHPNYN
ncbi:heat shock transcription factor, Y-linked-like [Camelus ferus]|uniref:Heat shock transcription factor, Y-linked-like n=1 Tax=Camelus ferus TaxID=419612 RepID=A0A8B8RBI9_CAMFR|nr:heat shock transcription factor, Y-linked-like [Camelus ferus]